jgi:hypothetical protein
MSEQPHLRLVDRLRGQYHLPVNDGAGPLNGSMTFSREFPTPPIQKEAADIIEQMLAVLKLCEPFCKGHQETPQRAARYQQVVAAIAKAEQPRCK